MQPGLDQPVDLGQRDLRLGLRRPRRLRHARRRTAVRIVGPAGRQKQPQPDRYRHFPARQRQRDQHLAVRRLAQLAAVLRRHADRSRALLGIARVIDHQHGIRATDLPVGLLGEHAPQWPVIPGRAGDEVVQLVVPGQPEPLGHRLDALRPVRPQQATHIQRRHVAPRAAASHIEERLKPAVEVAINVTRQCKRGSYLHACKLETQTYLSSAKVVLAYCTQCCGLVLASG